jgi:hypothetical protein
MSLLAVATTSRDPLARRSKSTDQSVDHLDRATIDANMRRPMRQTEEESEPSRTIPAETIGRLELLLFEQPRGRFRELAGGFAAELARLMWDLRVALASSPASGVKRVRFAP